MREKLKNFAHPYLARLYASQPVFTTRAQPPLFPCVVLSGVVFAVLYAINLLLSLLGFSWFSAHPGWLRFMSYLPGMIILADQKANGWTYFGFFIFSWLLVLIVGVVFLILLWSISGD